MDWFERAFWVLSVAYFAINWMLQRRHNDALDLLIGRAARHSDKDV